MANLRERLHYQASAYAGANGLLLGRFLGDGNDGVVWESSRQTATTAIERCDSYARERDCYLRLQDRAVWEIDGFAIPTLIDFDDTRQVVEMTVVFPPCLIDFAKAYVDRPPDFTLEVLNDWEAERIELFEGQWQVVESLLTELRAIGIHYYDAQPGNIRM